MERILNENMIKTRQCSISDFQDYIDHYHPGAKIKSTEMKTNKDLMQLTCEKGHEIIKNANSIKRGSWCVHCYSQEKFINEIRCKIIVENIFGVEFLKAHPLWLKSDKGRPLELDMYNEVLKIAFEHNGIQHYQFHPHFHDTFEDFYEQQRRDEIRRQGCQERGVILIEIPYWCDGNNLEAYIRKQLREYGFDV